MKTAKELYNRFGFNQTNRQKRFILGMVLGPETMERLFETPESEANPEKSSELRAIKAAERIWEKAMLEREKEDKDA